MKIQTLIENTTNSELMAEHGLSFYIETANHRLLVDTGSSDKFLENARLLGIDLSTVDLAILSHGHYDHSGGLMAFLEMNDQATVLMQETAAGEYYSDHQTSIDYIGIAPELKEHPRITKLSGDCRIDEELFLFTGVKHEKVWPNSNRTLFEKSEGQYIQDEFVHEQNLLITEDDKQVLICGCAHNGIVNILEKSHELTGRWPDVVIGGFHLIIPSRKSEADVELVTETARFLEKVEGVNGPTRYYTGHCTGVPSLKLLQELLPGRVEALYSGKEIE